ncbi:uncharacterized protein KY384_005645 [Bacidia gigantensis]|uniref:uncharacterized protein n=1 Tax=Bacidia gigantensis TaxID=2732470 RepID=UPI001D043F77|nr:uncharacterized protein KY384_005645 [Bacidia gigantensis]KAG8530162.1 hypothetical protein KY384_005645 [Bacidia gigantensis]
MPPLPEFSRQIYTPQQCECLSLEWGQIYTRDDEKDCALYVLNGIYDMDKAYAPWIEKPMLRIRHWQNLLVILYCKSERDPLWRVANEAGEQDLRRDIWREKANLENTKSQRNKLLQWYLSTFEEQMEGMRVGWQSLCWWKEYFGMDVSMEDLELRS